MGFAMKARELESMTNLASECSAKFDLKAVSRLLSRIIGLSRIFIQETHNSPSLELLSTPVTASISPLARNIYYS